ncbi:MAG: exodeoxyribonuclease V subunit gamma [Chromatiales bacterium]
MLHVVYSNRTEALADALLGILAQPPSSPLEPEQVVVPGAAVARWLTLRVADRFGICANLRFQYPAAFIWELLRAVAPQPLPAVAAFSPEINSWRLLRLLPRLSGEAGFGPVAHYLQNADECQRYELAARIAECFDRYLVFRPDWVRRWEGGQESHWQARLWRELVSEGGRQHWVHCYDDFVAALRRESTPSPRLPARVTVFGVHALSPSYLHVLNELSSRVTVHLLLLNPCRHYWGDIISARAQARLEEQGSALAGYAETGNTVLASMGRHGRDFIDAVGEVAEQGAERYTPPPDRTLLARIQADILELRDGEPAEERVPVEAEGVSLIVHACHSPMREVQVLHDQLLGMFERWADLSPSDIVVMAPDIERYAPAVAAVFATAAQGNAIPYHVDDARAAARGQIVETFLDLLALGHDRFEAQRILAPLDLPAVRRRFDLSEEECERIRDWVRDSGIRWGTEAAMRSELGLPGSGDHTWRRGLDRLLLGHALPQADALFGGLLPCDGAEGTQASALGKLLAYYDALLAVRMETRTQRRVGEWTDRLRLWLTALFSPQEAEEGFLAELRQAISMLEEETAQAAMDDPVGPELIGMRLQQLLETGRAGGSAVRGTVTFCNLSALPGVPSAIVCVLGLDGDLFPRNPARPDFDLMAAQWRRGDRSRRDEDRYLFLLALLSARRCLYLSYVGQDQHDNRVAPPSVVVDELLDYVDRNYHHGVDGGPLRDALLVRQPLQPFSRRYFDGTDPRLFSYREDNCIAAALGGTGQRVMFLSEPLPPAEAMWRQVSLDDLLAFYRHPVRFLLRRRLRIELGETTRELDDAEPFQLQRRDLQALREQWMARVQRGMSGDAAEALLRAGGMLPHGPIGDVTLRAQAEVAEALRARALAFGDLTTSTVAFDTVIGGFQLSGELTDVTRSGLLTLVAGEVYAGARIELWLRHLILHCVASGDLQRRTLCVAREKAFAFKPVSDAETLLNDLLEEYWRGLHSPLRFFPRSAYRYQRSLQNDKPEAVALQRAQKIWRGDEWVRGEGDDPYHHVAFGGDEPLDEEFAALARRICGPLIDHMEAL